MATEMKKEKKSESPAAKVEMTLLKTENSWEPSEPVPYFPTQFLQQTSYNQYAFQAGFYPGYPMQFLPQMMTHNPSSVSVPGPQPQPPPPPPTCPPLPVNSGDLTACQQHNNNSCLPQENAETSADCNFKPMNKRALRLMKNREAARECRRKKKEYIRCLENRVALLEEQNKILVEQLKAFKEYRTKME